MNKRALLLVDLQNDFFPGGALAVKNADGIFPLANDIQDRFSLIIASKDWHPPNHKSFRSQHPGHALYDVISLNDLPQVLWPDHCIQNTPGSDFHSALKTHSIQKIVYKGTDPEIDSYSTFFDNAHRKSTGLDDYLKSQHVTDIYIMGLATDYCVLFSVLDARKLGLNTFVIEDGCFGIDKNPNDIEKAKETMREAGAKLLKSSEISSDQMSGDHRV